MQNNQSTQHLLGLNPQQKDAVLTEGRIVYVSAGPGTGKTHMLTAKLIGTVLSETPQKIVALSYTNTAAREIGERFDRKFRETGLSREFSFHNGTIHSFCYRMMKLYGGGPFDYVILDEEELGELADEISDHYDGKYSRGSILSCLRSLGNSAPDGLPEQIEALKESFKVISIHDILVRFIRLMDEDAQFRRWLAGEVTFMAIDEAQDLSELNYTILSKMLEGNPSLKLFIVGDPRQNIFEFNGGSYRHLDAFLKGHPDHAELDLSITYRCPGSVSDYVNSFSFTDCPNVPLQPSRQDPGNVEVLRCRTESDEADRVIQSILRKGSLNSCAVLTNNLRYTEPLIRMLRRMEIPYKVTGGRRNLKRHIRFLNHILRIIDSDNSYSITRIAQYTGIDMTENGRRKKSKFYESDLGKEILAIRQEAEKMTFQDLLAVVIGRIMSDPSDDEETLRDYDDLYDMAPEFPTVSDYLTAFGTDRERFSQFHEKDYEECPVPNETESLSISTIHSAKGLEWDNVYVIGLCEGVFPNPYFCQDMPPEGQREFFNSERKKMYVAATRAKSSLTLSYPSSIMRKGYTFRKEPSRFIGNIETRQDESYTGVQRNRRPAPAGNGGTRPFVR